MKRRKVVGRPWTPEETRWLEANAEVPMAEKVAHLGRNVSAIRNKIWRGLRVQPEYVPSVAHEWNKQDLDRLRKHYGVLRVSEIAKMLGRTRNAVIGKAYRLGLCEKKDEPAQRPAVTYVPQFIGMPVPRARTCQWIGDAGERCDARATGGKSYCEHHAAMIYRPVSEGEMHKFINRTLKYAGVRR